MPSLPFIVVLALCVPFVAGHAVAADSTGSSGNTNLTFSPNTYTAGDKLKILFYEPLRSEDQGKFLGKPSVPGPSYYLHTELSGEYVVQPDESISVPMVGTVSVADSNQAQVQAKLTAGFEKLIGHPGFVSVVIAERQPIYVVGAVKQPGAYKYQPGLTPFALVALAGGEQNGQVDRWSVVEAVRVAGKEVASRGRLCELMAELAVLKAERKGAAAEVPPELSNQCGEKADRLISEAQANRAPIVQARGERLKALQLNVDALQSSIKMAQARLPDLGKGIDTRRDRLSSLQMLASHGDVQRVTINGALTDLLDAKDRREVLLGTIQEGEHRLAEAKIELDRLASDTEAELSNAIVQHKRDIAQLVPDVAADSGVVSLLQPEAGRRSALRFEVIRDRHMLPADVMTVLWPGDVLRVETQGPVEAYNEPNGDEGFKHLSQSR